MSAPERAVVWLRLQRGGRRAVEVGIDPTQVDRALAKWQRLLGTDHRLEVNVYPARDDAGPPNPVFGLPDLHGDPLGRWPGTWSTSTASAATPPAGCRPTRGWSG